MNLKDFKKLNLPDKPGVYFFLQKKEILYIGKATSLRDRVKSYFGKDLIDTRGPVILDMVFKADNIKWIETDSVLEALILEAELIKKYQPKYNTKEKSDKSFNYVAITKINTIKVIRGKELKQNEQNFKKTYGPFPNGSQLKEALKIIRKFFPYLEDRKGTKGRDEFYKQIRLVPENSRENIKNIKNIELFFEGKKKNILNNLTKEMKLFAKDRYFEDANEIKKKIFALNHINDIALLKYDKENINKFRIEAYDIAHMSGKSMVGVMTVVEDGEPNKNEYRKFKIRSQLDANDTGALAEILERRFAHSEWQMPSIVVVDGGVAQINAAKGVLKNFSLNIEILSVLKDERHKPKNILGDKKLAQKYEREILFANSEAHRFAIKYHKDLRNKNFLK